jgi:hypothetical protein
MEAKERLTPMEIAKGKLMTFSNSPIFERNRALAKKFQGNGWALTCSTASHNELSAIIGGEEGTTKVHDIPVELPELPLIRYQSDWADTVLGRSMNWRAEQNSAPSWLTRATEGAECALFQLPRPDHRWVVKFRGKILEPFNYRMAGWAELHEIMEHGFLLDRTGLIEGLAQKSQVRLQFATVADLRKQRGDLLRSTELIRTINNQEYGHENQKTDGIQGSVSGTRLRGFDTQTVEGKIQPDKWRSCADDFNKQVRDRLDRVFAVIKRQDDVAAAAIKRAIRFNDGQWSFNDSVKWMTSPGQLPYDATMVLTGKSWEINFPDSSEPLTVPNSTGMRAIARVLMCGNIACPCALVVDGPLLDEFLGRPSHHKYFAAIYRRPKVECGGSKNGEVERAICAAMRLKAGWYYLADHVIAEDSELHTVCGLPAGMVTLRRADALEGVRDLIKRQRARLFFCSEPTPQFTRILADIEAGIVFARKQEKLLEQVQPKSEEYQPNIQKAIYRIKTELEKMGDWTSRYDRLANHFSRYIKGGIVFQYTGPYRWKIEGLPETPDTHDLATDHVQFKRSRLAKRKRQAKPKLQAMRALKISRGSA